MQQQESDEPKNREKSNPCLIIFSLINILLIFYFINVIISTLYSTANNEIIFAVCGRKLWNLLFIHVSIPLCATIFPLILSFFMVPILLSYTHKNPFWLFLFPLLCFITYNATTLSLGIEYVIEAQNNESCYAALSGTHLIILTWVFIALDSIALFIELCCLIIMLCIQGLDQNIKY